MNNSLKIVIAQQMFSVGDVKANQAKMIEGMQKAYALNADICVFPELALCGYPPEDLLWNADFKHLIQESFHQLLQATKQYPQLTLMFGFPHYEHEIYNGMAVLKNGEILEIIHKQFLPNQGVFEEQRYFTQDGENNVMVINNIKVGLLICEDVWHDKPIDKLRRLGAEMLLVINTSPYSIDKHKRRLEVLAHAAKKNHHPIIYLNGMNAQDDLMFDGGSCVVDKTGQLMWQGEFFRENLYLLNVTKKNDIEIIAEHPSTLMPTDEELIYQALVLGLREYVRKNKIKGVIVGTSGGIDSALVLAIAVDALGADKVIAVAMPSRYTAQISTDYAKQQAETLGVEFKEIAMDDIFQHFLKTLTPHFKDFPIDATEENIQSRCRGTLLMGLANKYHYIVLGTSNKSELAVGYGTLYGDMIGAYAVLKDVVKIWVYRLARYRNLLSEVIPPGVIQRAPSAELAPNQFDQDSLPPYEILDDIIERYVEQRQSIAEIIASGKEANLVYNIVRRIDQNEYKRRQGPPGTKVTECAFTRERHFPITCTTPYSQ